MKKLIMALMMVLPMSVFAQKFGHFDSAEVIQAMPEFTSAQTELETKAKSYEEELKRMQDELKTKVDDYQKNEATLVDAVKERRQQELQDLNQRLEEYYSTSQKELQQLQSQKMGELQQKVLKAVEDVGIEGGYVYIMDTSSGIPYISKTLSNDVTPQVKSKLGLK